MKTTWPFFQFRYDSLYPSRGVLKRVPLKGVLKRVSFRANLLN